MENDGKKRLGELQKIINISKNKSRKARDPVLFIFFSGTISSPAWRLSRDLQRRCVCVYVCAVVVVVDSFSIFILEGIGAVARQKITAFLYCILIIFLSFTRFVEI